MKSTDATPTMKRWKAVWLNAQKFCKGVGGNLWSLTRAINDIFDDSEFRADNGLRDDLAAAEWIDSKLPHIPLSYMELRVILEHYPDRIDWEKTKISKLRESIRPAKRERQPKPTEPKRPTIEEVAKQRDYFEARSRFLESELTATNQGAGIAPRPRPADLEAAARAVSRNDGAAITHHARELTRILAASATKEALSDDVVGALAELHAVIMRYLDAVTA